MAKNASVQTVEIVFSFWSYAVENPAFFGVWNKLLEGDQSYKIKNGMQSGRCTRNGVARMVPCHKRFERIQFTHTAFRQFSQSFQTVLTIRLCPFPNPP